MTSEVGSAGMLRVLAPVFSVANLFLALIFFPLVPLLGWLNYGRAGRATAWIPDAVTLTVLPAAYYVYWHYWFIVAGVALVFSVSLWRQRGPRSARVWALVNGATIAMYLVVRIILTAQGIRPDIV
jgi:hypothetical protein